MSKEAREYWALQRRLAVFEYAKKWGNATKACRAFCMPRATYYRWKKAFDTEGAAGLIRKKPIARNHPNKIPDSTVIRSGESRRRAVAIASVSQEQTAVPI